MKKRQIHLSLTEDLYQLLKEQANHYGLPLTHCVKYILVRELHAHPINLNIRRQPEEVYMKDDIETFNKSKGRF